MNLIAYLKNAVYPHTGTPVIAFLGDSVTHGAFECIQGDTAGCIFDFDAVYHERLRRMLLTVNPWLPVSIINAGGNPLQYSCLENPMDRGAWQAAVYKVTKSQTRLK